jgi:hypothetical protein
MILNNIHTDTNVLTENVEPDALIVSFNEASKQSAASTPTPHSVKMALFDDASECISDRLLRMGSNRLLI